MNATGHLPIELLSAHLDGETSPEERARVEAHLAGCERCRSALDDLRAIAEASARIVTPDLPEGLRERVMASVGRPGTARRAWIGAAASIAAMGLVATAWYLQGPEGPVPNPPPAPARAPVPNPAPAAAAPEVDRLKPLGSVGREEKSRSAAAPRGAKDAEVARAPTIDAEVHERASGDFLRDSADLPPAMPPLRRENVAASSEAPVGARLKQEAIAQPEALEKRVVEVAGGVCGDVEFIEVSVGAGIAPRPLEEALLRQGALPRPESRPGTLTVVVPDPRRGPSGSRTGRMHRGDDPIPGSLTPQSLRRARAGMRARAAAQRDSFGGRGAPRTNCAETGAAGVI
jgi:hypothetical protein